jgi:opacity protein-like surface antigen
VPKGVFSVLSILIVIFGVQEAEPLAQLTPLCVYSRSESIFQDLKLSGSYNYVNDPDKNRPANNVGNLTLSFDHFSDAPSLGFLVDANAKADLKQNKLAYEAKGRVNVRSYWGKSDAFGNGEIEVGTIPTAQGVINLGVKARAGLGYGRFRDVTPYSKALRIQTQLIEMKSLNQPLPAKILQLLSDLIARVGEFVDTALLVQKLAEILEHTESLVKKPLGAIELLRIEEILKEGDNKRCGWDVNAGVSYQLVDTGGQPRELFLHTEFNYALAPAPRSQFTSKIGIDAQLDFLEEHVLIAEANYSYRFSDRMDSQVKYKFQSNKVRKSASFETQSIFIGANFQAQANLNLTVQLYLTHNTGFEEWAQQLTVTWNYDFF